MRKKRGNLCALHNAYNSETDAALLFIFQFITWTTSAGKKPTLFISSIINSERRWVVRVRVLVACGVGSACGAANCAYLPINLPFNKNADAKSDTVSCFQWGWRLRFQPFACINQSYLISIVMSKCIADCVLIQLYVCVCVSPLANETCARCWVVHNLRVWLNFKLWFEIVCDCLCLCLRWCVCVFVCGSLSMCRTVGSIG